MLEAVPDLYPQLGWDSPNWTLQRLLRISVGDPVPRFIPEASW